MSERMTGWPVRVVVRDGCGQGEDALQDADDQSGWGVPAVAFKVEVVDSAGST